MTTITCLILWMPAGALHATDFSVEGLVRAPSTTMSVATPSATTAAKRNDRINHDDATPVRVRRQLTLAEFPLSRRRRPSGEELEQQLVEPPGRVELHPGARALDSLVPPRAADVLAGAEHAFFGEVVVTV